MQYLGQPAEALLQWRHDGQHCQLNLASQGGPSPPLQQASRGELDANGLAPERFINQRRGRGQRAANFQREAARISFSAAEWQLPAWLGAQDRLGWLMQLSGFAAAAGVAGNPLPEVRLYVVDARGCAELWRLRAEVAETLGLPIGPTAAQPWRREPDRPDGLRVDVWLDPQRGHWPLRWRYTLLRTGAVIDWLLVEPPGTTSGRAARSNRPGLNCAAAAPCGMARRIAMHMLYNSDNFVVVRFDVAAEPDPTSPALASPKPGDSVANPAHPVLSRGGFEIVDKFARKEIFIQGAVAERFQQGVQALVAEGPNEEALDEYIGQFATLAQQPVLLH